MVKNLFLTVLIVLFAFMGVTAQTDDMLLKFVTTADNQEIGLPLNGTVNVTVDWGDGSATQTVTSAGTVKHSYASAGTYTVTISGNDGTNSLTHFGYSLYGGSDLAALTEIIQWGNLGITDLSNACYGASSLTSVPNSLPPGVTNLQAMFSGASSFNQDISGWDVSSVTNMMDMFDGASSFNQDISTWEVSNVTNMASMFSNARVFNQDLNTWDVSKVTDMNHMFYFAMAFNGNISSWNVSNVTNMADMFRVDDAFNQDISGWNVGNVTNMSEMFFADTHFNQDIGSWDVSNVTNMSKMFAYSSFNQNIGSWDVSKVTDMSEMFEQDPFNQDISSWNVSNVTNMSKMFANTYFNQDISGWNVSKVTDMSSMFYNCPFNQDISGWDVSQVTNMDKMFYEATDFDQNLGSWNFGNVTTMVDMFYHVTLSVKNYDGLLTGLAGQTLKNNVTFSAGDSKCSCVGYNAKVYLFNTYNWSISDGGMLTGYLSTPVITTQPVAQTVSPGSDASFYVEVSDDYGVSYQWQKDGVDLSDGGNISGATSNQLVLSNVSASDQGTYQCIVSNCQGDTVISDAVALSVSGTTVINEVQSRKIRIYPNPAKSLIYIDIAGSQNQPEVIKITDISGRVIKKFDGKIHQIDLSAFPAGTYFILVQSSEKISTLRIIKE